eukprot:767830-Hanusia_phi.AAC.1
MERVQRSRCTRLAQTILGGSRLATAAASFCSALGPHAENRACRSDGTVGRSGEVVYPTNRLGGSAPPAPGPVTRHYRDPGPRPGVSRRMPPGQVVRHSDHEGMADPESDGPAAACAAHRRRRR